MTTHEQERQFFLGLLKANGAEALKDADGNVVKTTLGDGEKIEWMQMTNKGREDGDVVTSSGVTYTFSKGVWSLSGTCSSSSNSYCRLFINYENLSYHKLVSFGVPDGCSSGTYNTFFRYNYVASSFHKTTQSEVFTIPQNSYNGIEILIQVNREVNVDGITFTPQVFDLTAMFGAGNEPTTAKAFAQTFGYSSIDDMPYFSPDKNGTYVAYNHKLYKLQ